jgi:monoterpene epsilon-lactone hydrolase
MVGDARMVGILMRHDLFSRTLRFAGALLLAVLVGAPVWIGAQVGPHSGSVPGGGPQVNSSVLDSQGTAHITRVVPVPTTISPEAQGMLRRPAEPEAKTLEERRRRMDEGQARGAKAWLAAYPVKLSMSKIAGVPVRDVLPLDAKPMHPDRVLIDLHGGGFNADSGSLVESIPMANLTHTRVVAVLYRLAPEHPFPAAVDDAIAVYRELLKSYKPGHIGLYGTSAGAGLTAEVAVRMKQLGLPLPGALGIFSGLGDLSQSGDSHALFTGNGLKGELPLPVAGPRDKTYIGSANPKDPVLSPMYADLHGMPPTLFITSGRDMQLSGTTTLHRAYLRAGVDARLVVFEGLPHAFWYDASLPESKEACGLMADFFTRELGR